MTAPTNEALAVVVEALLDALMNAVAEQMLKRPHTGNYYDATSTEARAAVMDAIRTAIKDADRLAALASGSAEPVAWMYETGEHTEPEFTWSDTVQETMQAKGFKVTPLYLHPARPDLGAWLPISEAPKDGRHIIVSGGIAYWRERANHWEGPSGWYTITGFDYPGRPIQWEVTHWMPLPPPPTEGER